MSRSSTVTAPRCRACGSPLVGGRHGRACPRCHPQEAAIAAQLELTFGQTASDAPPEPAPAPASWAAAAIEEVTPSAPVSAPSPAPAPPAAAVPKARSTRLTGALRVLGGMLILAGGLSWAGYQMWPRGVVEQKIVQQFAAMPRFVERTGPANPLHQIATEAESTPTFADLNGDDLPELITGSRAGGIHIVRNTGRATQPRFASTVNDPYGLVTTDTANALAFAELRQAGLRDAVNAGANGAISFFQNRGDGRHPNFVLLAPEDDPFAVTAAPRQSLDWRPTFADLDRDYDADLIVGTRDGTILYLENRGTPTRPEFAGVTRLAPFGLRPIGDHVSIGFGDIDGDGDLDAVAGNGAGELRYFENRGNAWRPQFHLTPAGTIGLSHASPLATVALVDLDGDGDIDCVTGGADGHFRYFENVRTVVPVETVALTTPTPAPRRR